MKIVIEKLDEVHLRIFCDDMGVEQDLCDFFTYEYPGARFTPKYKARIWDGKVRLLDPIRKTLYVGLLPYVLNFAKRNNYEIQLNSNFKVNNNITYEITEQYLKDLNLPEKIELRDYQIDAVRTALDDERALLISPTGSGKSLIIYAIMRWHVERNLKCIIIVPTTSLVEQLFSDFEDYSSKNGFDVKDNCQKLYSGFSKTFTKNVLLTTWQSVYLQPKPWFAQFDVLFGDEAHTFKANSLTGIMGKMDQVKYRIGTTGTLDNKKIHKLVLEGMFSVAHQVTTTKKLMDTNRLATLDIKAVVLKYKEEVRKEFKGTKYADEINFLVSNKARNNFIRNLALSCEGNTLVLFQLVKKHGMQLDELIRSKAADGRKVFFVHGSTAVSDREEVRRITEQETDAIIIASYGTFSAGINIPSIQNVIFASPTKSKIRNLQSIGRGLRTSKGKTVCKLFDISDDLHWKSWNNYTLLHAAERYKTYSEEEFNIQIIEVNI